MRSIVLNLGALVLALSGLAFGPFARAQQDNLLPTGKQDDYLPPEQAYLYAVGVQDDRILVSWIITPGYYLYRKRLGFESATPEVKLGEPDFPQGEAHHDEYFGDQEIYRGTATIAVPFSVTGARPAQFTLKLKWQGCADAGLCYPPTTWTTTVDLPAKTAAGASPVKGPGDATSSAAGTATKSGGSVISEQDRLARLIRDGNLSLVLASFFGFGLLLALTPCVLPMVPILAGIIAGQGNNVSPKRGFSLAFIYVQGMALTYAVAGSIFVLAFEQAPQAFFQKPWIVILFALLFVALALAMFGVWTLQLPSALQTRLTNASNRQKSGTYTGTFIMGALSALIVTACVAPAIIAALSVIGQTGEIARGAAALYVTGLGMGVPLLIVGASAGSLLPRAGPWMDAVKSLFGVLFLAVAIYLLAPLLPGAVTLLLWAALAVISGFWIFSLKARDGGPAPAAVRAVGLIALVYGIILLVGLASGSRDPLQPLDALRGGASGGAAATPEHGLAFQRIKTVADLDQALAAASDAGKPVMLDFYADWCVSCKEMEKYTFTDASVQAALANAVLLQADVTANDEQDQSLLKRFGIFGPPTIAFFGTDGVERKNFRLVGYVNADKFREHVKQAFSAAPPP